MKIRQLSIYLENRPQQLSAICRTLSASNINIVTLSLADTSDFGLVRMIVDDHDLAKKVLSEAGFAACVHEVVAVCVPDRPGGMAEVMAVIDGSGSNIEYAYAFSFHRGDKAVLVFRFENNAVVEAALAAAGMATLSEGEVGELAR